MTANSSAIRLLIAEDEANLSLIIEQFFRARGFDVTMVRNGRDAIERLRNDRFDVVLLDIVMPHVDGLDVLRQVRSRLLPPEVIVVSGNSTVDTALAAMKLGAYDMLAKPYRMAEVEAVVRRAWEKRVLVRRNAALEAQVRRHDGDPLFETQFAPMRATLSLAERTSNSDAPVLFSGETGSGKESLARHLHARGNRAGEPFVVVSGRELFADHAEMPGFESGAGTTGEGTVDAATPIIHSGDFDIDGGGDCDAGSDTASAGGIALNSTAVLEVAGAGTLFIRDVEHLSEGAQRRLLVGLVSNIVDSQLPGARKIPLQARVMASTTLSDDLLRSMLDEDLLRLLTSVRITVPPLRDRATDIPLLARRFLAAAGSAYEPEPAVMELLAGHSWAGNVAELRLVMERAALLAGDSPVGVRHIALAPVEVPEMNKSDRAREGFGQLADLERRHIAHALEYTGWHQGKASELLGISPKTLYRKIREYGFVRPERSSAGGHKQD